VGESEVVVQQALIGGIRAYDRARQGAQVVRMQAVSHSHSSKTTVRLGAANQETMEGMMGREMCQGVVSKRYLAYGLPRIGHMSHGRAKRGVATLPEGEVKGMFSHYPGGV